MRHWIQRIALPATMMLAVAACAGDGEAAATSAPTSATTTSQAPSSTTGAIGDGEPTPTTGTMPETPQVEGPAAPDFVFALGDGTSFSLSDEQKPVYLVFWAEW
ncbi:MAG: TlpA family protein disulfide reductase [Acidimicrobiia bacterium]